MASKTKIIIDTSVQISKFKYKEIQDHIISLSEHHEASTSFYVYFEFKVGLILSLINYWELVNISATVPDAINRWSETQSKREPKFFMFFEALRLKYFKHHSTSKKKYLRQIEYIIYFLLSNFFKDINKFPVGDFRHNEIVRFNIVSSGDYPEFVKLCKDKKEMADQTEFWRKHKNELSSLVASQNLATNYKKMHSSLSKIQTDLKYASMNNTNKAVGDAVIAVDTKQEHTILTLDKSFETLGPILSRKVQRIPNKYL